MKIAFLGDSITEAVPGVSYVDMLKDKLKDHILDNYGKGGDTVSSLKKRIKKIHDLHSYNVIILFIGVNDVFGKLTPMYKLIKTLMRQRWTKNTQTFEYDYREILKYIQINNSRIIVIPPLLIGEDINNKWNTELKHYVLTIEKLIKDYPQVEYLDIRRDFINHLSEKEISEYVPNSLMELLNDVKDIHSNQGVDDRSESRGLYLTLDGVHINSQGAQIIADRIYNSLIKIT